MTLATTTFEFVALAVFGGWLLISLGVTSRLLKRVPCDWFRLAPRWNLFSAGQEKGQAAMAIYYIDTLADGSEAAQVCLTEGIRYWRPSVPFWSASLPPIVLYRRLAKTLIRLPDHGALRENGAYQRLIHLIRREPKCPEAVSRRFLVFAERTQSPPELVFESPDEPV